MPSKFSVTGLDFDDIFEPRNNSVPTVAFGYKVNGLDISGRYEISTVTGSLNGDQIGFDTNYKYNNLDLRYFFRAGSISIIISAQPQPDTVLETETGEFTITAVGTGTLLYQWQKYDEGTASWNNLTNSANQIAGATTANLQILNADYPTDEGSYRCVLTDDISSLNSQPATLTVNYLPVITTEPVSNIYNDDNVVSYEVVATEGKPAGLTYKWQRLTTDAGAVWTDLSAGSETDIGVSYTTDNLTFRCQLARADYQYRCIVSNSAGSDTSNAAILYINPKITSNLLSTKSVTVPSGQDVTYATFTIQAGGSATLDYQWYKKYSGGNFQEIGESSPTFQDEVDETSNNAQYYCVVSSKNGENQRPGTTVATSVTCTLSVGLTSISISSFLGNGVANPTVNEGQLLSYVVQAAGSGTLTYTFYKRVYTSRPLVFSDTQVQTGTNNTYDHNVLLSENDYDYFCVVSSSKAGLTPQYTALSTLTVNYAPIISTQPVSSVYNDGNAVSYSVVATGKPATLTYKWQRLTTDPGAVWTDLSTGSETNIGVSYTTNNLTFNCQLARADYQYRCVVTNSAGSTNSNSAILYINPKFNTNGDLPPTKSVTVPSGADTVAAIFTIDAGGSATLYYQWYKKYSGGSFTPIAQGTDPAFLDTVDESSNNAQYYCVISSRDENNNQRAGTSILTSSTSTLTVNLTPISISSFLGNGVANPTVNEGSSVSYVVQAAGSGTLYYDFYRIDPGGNTLVQDSEVLNSNTYTHNAIESENGKQFFCAVSSNKAGLIPQNTSPSTLTVRYVRITGGTINNINYLLSVTNNAIYTVTTSAVPAVNSYSWKKNGVVVSTQSSYSFIISSDSDAATYSVEVSNGFFTASASSILYVQPYINTHPASVTVDQGGTAAFTVSAGGSNKTYQWQLSTNSGGSWSNIANANSTSYQVSNVTESESGYQYRCVISNSAPANNVPPYTTINAVSNPATLTVAYAVEYYFNGSWNLLSISGGVGSFSVNGGTLAGMKVLMQNYSTNTYTWQKLIGANWTNQYGPRNGNLVPSENGDQIVWNPISINEAGSWRCIISNALNGSPITSAQFNMTVVQYTLTVVNGTGGGTQNPGYTYNITANAPAVGYSYANPIWTDNPNNSATFGNENAASTTCVISQNSTVTANYVINQYTLVALYGDIAGGTPSGDTSSRTANYGTTYSVTRRIYTGYTFTNWQLNSGSITYVNSTSSTSFTINVTIGAGNAEVEAKYTPNNYTLTVNNGTGGGTAAYAEPNGHVYNIVANDPPEGMVFDGWAVTTGLTVTFGDQSASSTTCTIGAQNSTVTATYVDI